MRHQDARQTHSHSKNHRQYATLLTLRSGSDTCKQNTKITRVMSFLNTSIAYHKYMCGGHKLFIYIGSFDAQKM